MNRRLRAAAAIVLLAGLACAAVIYLKAGGEPADSALQEYYNSKKYVRGMELYAGKMAVLEDEISRWFGSLWHGTRLAATVACIALAISGTLALVARRAGAEPVPDGGHGTQT